MRCSLPARLPLLGPAPQAVRTLFSCPGVTRALRCGARLRGGVRDGWPPALRPLAPGTPDSCRPLRSKRCQFLAPRPFVFWSLRPSGQIASLQSMMGGWAGPHLCPDDNVLCYPGSDPGSRLLPQGPRWLVVLSKLSQS